MCAIFRNTLSLRKLNQLISFNPKNMKQKIVTQLVLAFFAAIFLSSCITIKKYNAYISEQYNNELPPVIIKKKANNISLNTEAKSATDNISNSVKTSNVLPLLVYWKIEEKRITDLNTQLAVGNFARTFTAASVKSLDKILNGRQLELTVKQVPSTFSMDYKEHIVVVVFYPVSWSRIYMHPEVKDLIVSYSFHESDSTLKTGTITIKNKQHDEDLRLFQSWKSAVSEYIVSYDEEVADMTKEFVNKLVEELNGTTTQ